MRIVGIFTQVCLFVFYMAMAQAGLKLMIDPLASVYRMWDDTHALACPV